MAAGAAGTTTWCNGTCVTTKRGPSLFDGDVTTTRVPSPRECSDPCLSPPWPTRTVAGVATPALSHAQSLQPDPWGAHGWHCGHPPWPAIPVGFHHCQSPLPQRGRHPIWFAPTSILSMIEPEFVLGRQGVPILGKNAIYRLFPTWSLGVQPPTMANPWLRFPSLRNRLFRAQGYVLRIIQKSVKGGS